MKDETSPFHQFIAEWRERRLADVGKAELSHKADRLGQELRDAALEAGFRRHLTNACRPYRSMAAYVRGLHDLQTTRHRQ